MISQALYDMDARRVRFRSIDWGKVVTLEDYRTVLRSLISEHVAIPADHPRVRELERYLKEEKL